MPKINASIVLYHNKKEQITKVIGSFLSTELEVKLYLIDNSLNDELKELSSIDNRIEYIFNDENLGYGAGHNIAMKESIKNNVSYHVVLNPDIYFSQGVLEKLFSYMESNNDIGNIIPQVRYPNGEIQHLCKLLPTPTDLILRKFILSKRWKDKRNQKYEIRDSGYNKTMNVASLSGFLYFLGLLY